MGGEDDIDFPERDEVDLSGLEDLSGLTDFTANPLLGPRPATLGIPVDMARHGGAFKRNWPEPYREPGTASFPRKPPPAPPQVPCRDATAEETPDTAATAAANARASGWDVRVTYSRGGVDRWGGARGECACGATPLLLVGDGSMRNHNIPQTKCAGTVVQFGRCTTCGVEVKTKKDGTSVSHKVPNRPCAHGGEVPEKTIPGPPMPPKEAVVVRVRGVGAGVWIDRGFAFAFVHDGTRWRPVGADEFQLAMKTRKKESSDSDGDEPSTDPGPQDAAERLG